MKKNVILLGLCLLAFSCGKKQPAETTADMHNAANSLDYAGTYKGTLPAADCPGIETTLTLNADTTFLLHMSYIDRNSSFEEQGRYSLDGNLLTLKSENGTPQYYKMGENRVSLLDADKQEITGALAPHYVLNKQESIRRAKRAYSETSE